MAGKCDLCGKGPGFGNHVSHSNHHTKRMFKANIQSATLMIDGQKKRVKACTRCLRTMMKPARMA